MIEKLDLYMENLKQYFKENTSTFYYFLSAFAVLGMMFFVFSNKLYSNNNTQIRSTTINEMQKTNTLNSKIISRKYNPLSKTVEFIIYTDDVGNIDNKQLQFELREQQNPSKIIETRYQHIDSNYYVIFAKVPKNWEVLSLSIGYQNDTLDTIEEAKKDDKKSENNTKFSYKSTLLSVVRIYSDRDDIKEDSLLKEKKSDKYFEEIIDIEIDFLSENIKEFSSILDGEYKTISDAKSKINELESDKKYQTESEQNQTDINISKLNSLINSSNSTIENTTKSIKELEEKIKKLEEKRKDF
jgi:bacterioferritin (cytochrome b1)/polyhydroxyalkanoate synthesis regulator phasin